mmetsp:Transcript_2082/g.4836  ORF Transcript_2082/g.4836 Transcript_2082/m.4836 type:complete len:194 (-) Transcript_2082:1347-1928(-)
MAVQQAQKGREKKVRYQAFNKISSMLKIRSGSWDTQCGQLCDIITGQTPAQSPQVVFYMLPVPSSGNRQSPLTQNPIECDLSSSLVVASCHLEQPFVKLLHTRPICIHRSSERARPRTITSPAWRRPTAWPCTKSPHCQGCVGQNHNATSPACSYQPTGSWMLPNQAEFHLTCAQGQTVAASEARLDGFQLCL